MNALAIIILLITSGCAFGQTVKDRKYRLAFMVPDTMIIDSTLLVYAQAVESEHVNDYYRMLQEMEDQLQSWKSRDSLSRFPMTTRAMDERLDSAKTLESEVRRYKYFYKIADYARYHFKSTCGDHRSDSDFLIVGLKKASRRKLKEIVEKFNLDYLLQYTQITAKGRDKKYQMKLTATLYSKNIKVLFKDEFVTNSKCPDDKLRCLTPLCCMLTNIAKSSTDKVCEKLEGLRKK